MDSKAVAGVLKVASSQLRKFESESVELRRKIAELEARWADEEKTAKAHRLAMRLSLDEDQIRDISDKTAKLKDQDLTVVEKAMDLDLNKIASLGEIEETSKKPTDLLSAVASILKK